MGVHRRESARVFTGRRPRVGRRRAWVAHLHACQVERAFVHGELRARLVRLQVSHDVDVKVMDRAADRHRTASRAA